MSMKKILSVLAALALCAAVMLCISACGGEEVEGTTKNDCEHSYSEWKTVSEPTCAKEGQKVRTCSKCGSEDTAAIATLEHVYSTEGKISKPANCIRAGAKKFLCTGKGCNKYRLEEYYLTEMSASELYIKTLRSVGEIVTYDKKGNEINRGMGLVYTAGGKIITNYHVFDRAYYATFEMSGTTYGIDSVVAYDKDVDLIVLQIVIDDAFDAANICTQPLTDGETVYVIGTPQGTVDNCQAGVIIDASKTIDGVVYVQHDAPISGVNTGGPLVNSYGEVVGINNSKISDEKHVSLSAFVTEIDKLKNTTEMTVREFYELNNNPYELMLSWLVVNYNNDVNGNYCYEFYENYVLYTMGYDNDAKALYLNYYNEYDNGAQTYLTVILGADPTKYEYTASYSYEGATNVVKGMINANTFEADTILTNTSYDGGEWTETEMMELYSANLVDLLAWFDWAAYSNGIGITSLDFGFEVFEMN